MAAKARRISWVVAPPELCCLCKEPLTQPNEVSAWNGVPAHRECVRIHLVQRDPAFREGDAEDAPEESAETLDGVLPRDDDETNPGG
jgi:hypothetical protein